MGIMNRPACLLGGEDLPYYGVMSIPQRLPREDAELTVAIVGLSDLGHHLEPYFVSVAIEVVCEVG